MKSTVKKNRKKESNKKCFDGTCHCCGMKGHEIDDCYKLKSKKRNEKIEKNQREMTVLCLIIDEYEIKQKS